ncbi:hypothetical protein [[Eubacterium] cellulosolvens]
MNLIDLSDFIENVKRYQNSVYALDSLYQRIVKRRDIWDRLNEITDYSTETIVLNFLNQWKCRLSYVCAPSLAKTLRSCSQIFSQFRDDHLEKVNPDYLFNHSEPIEEAFWRISSVRAGRRSIGPTATSKILHLVNPQFFMMYDRNIRLGYGCSENESGYMHFMLIMKQLGDNLIYEYASTRKISKTEALHHLAAECKSSATTLPKLLDEYNWIEFNL